VAVVAATFAIVSSTFGQLDQLRNLTRQGEPTKKIAHFAIKGPLAETPMEIPPLFGNEPPLSLKALLERFKQARMDSEVVAVVVDLQESALGLAQLEEVHAAMRKVAAAEKDVHVHADALSTLTYAAATGASHISVVPTGVVWLTGFYGESPYLRGTLDKIGVVPDFEQCGDFKSAAEMLTRAGPSEEAQQMNKWLIDSLYDSMVRAMADARGKTPEEMRALIDNGPYTAEAALEAGLIDEVTHRQDFVTDLKGRYGANVEVVMDYGEAGEEELPDNIFAAFEKIMQIFAPTPKSYSDPTIAIVYVEGMIQTGSAEVSPFGMASGAFSTTIRKALDKAAAEDAVKAVVLRVDSPGGSALASEIILDATKRVAGRKPLIVSMGNVAGSGGYYVTCGAETVFADERTITASIGVISGKLVTTAMWDKLGVSWHPTQRGEMASLLSSAAPFSDKERAKMRHYMETVYGIFKDHVIKARGDRLTKPIDELAGGRVFTGEQAHKLGLIDQIGGLDDAIKFAAKKARLGEYDIRIIPEPPTIFDLLMGGETDEEFAYTLSQRRAGSLADTPLFRELLPTLATTDPLRFNAILRSLQKVELIHREGVATVMPYEVVVP
jgi:protease-4